MIYYVFNTKAAAIAADQTIASNVRAWAEANASAVLDGSGNRLRGRNAATGDLVDVFTDRWAEPMQTNSGKWVFEKPSPEKTAPIPLNVFVAGIQAQEQEFDSSWFSSQYQ